MSYDFVMSQTLLFAGVIQYLKCRLQNSCMQLSCMPKKGTKEGHPKSDCPTDSRSCTSKTGHGSAALVPILDVCLGSLLTGGENIFDEL